MNLNLEAQSDIILYTSTHSYMSLDFRRIFHLGISDTEELGSMQ